MKDEKKFAPAQKLSLEDFKLNRLDASNEIEKMLGGAAADCHQTTNFLTGTIDWVDYE